MNAKALKPSEYLKRGSKNAFVNFMLAMTVPEWRRHFMGFDGYFDCEHNILEQYHFTLSMEGFSTDLQGDDMSLLSAVSSLTDEWQKIVMESVYATLNFKPDPDSPGKYRTLDDLAIIAARIFELEGRDLLDNLAKLVRYLIPDAKVIATAIELLDGRSDKAMPDCFRKAFVEIYDDFDKALDEIATSIIDKYNEQKLHLEVKQ